PRKRGLRVRPHRRRAGHNTRALWPAPLTTPCRPPGYSSPATVYCLPLISDIFKILKEFTCIRISTRSIYSTLFEPLMSRRSRLPRHGRAGASARRRLALSRNSVRHQRENIQKLINGRLRPWGGSARAARSPLPAAQRRGSKSHPRSALG